MEITMRKDEKLDMWDTKMKSYSKLLIHQQIELRINDSDYLFKQISYQELVHCIRFLTVFPFDCPLDTNRSETIHHHVERKPNVPYNFCHF